MRVNQKVLLVIVVLAMVLTGCAGGGTRYTVTGTVLESGSVDVPLSGVTISIGSKTATTNAEGQFSVSGVPAGEQTLTATLTGYESASLPIDVSGNMDVPISLVTNGPALSLEQLVMSSNDVAIEDGAEIEDTFILLEGNVNDLVAERNGVAALTTAITIEELEALINGTVYQISIEDNGDFSQPVPLDPGENTIQLRVRDAMGNAGTSGIVRVSVTVPRLDIRVVLTWDAANDVDIHMFKRTSAEGNVHDAYYAWDEDRHVCYWNKTPEDFGEEAVQNPVLDIDDTEGYGPETIVMQEATPGDYHIWVHFYSSNGLDTNAVVRVMLNSGTTAFTQTVYELEMPAADGAIAYYLGTVRVSTGSMRMVNVEPEEYEGDDHDHHWVDSLALSGTK